MFESEGEVARLESRALTAMQDIEINVFGNDTPDRMRELFMLACAAVVEDLNPELVTWPVEARGSSCDPYREHAFFTHRQLDEHFGKYLVGQRRGTQAGLGAEVADKTKGRELRRKKCKQD
jgi:hypothetical protein